MPIDRFNRERFEKFLFSLHGDWESKFHRGELRYSRQYGKKGKVFVGSSLGHDGRAKSTGKDSIRVWITYDGKHMKDSQRWTTRVLGWEERLKKRIHDACILIRDIEYSPRCPNCGGPMVIRKGVHGRFYGCLKFPKCRGTKNYSEEAPRELEFVT